MRIAVDLDGVVYEWQRTYRYMMREYRGVDMPPVEKFWTEWNAPDQFTTPEDRDWIWSEGVKLGLFRYGHMVTGARMGLQELAACGHKLEIVTSRPAQAVSDTLDWVSLFFKGIPLHGFHILTNGESKSQVDADILIDDRPENIDDWLHNHRWSVHAVVFDQPWNRQYKLSTFAYRAYGWADVTSIISRLAYEEAQANAL